ncbi:MAG: hypothetical protein HKN16_01720 [Saprospiraceae bacterium]|nr:hypothetical protein [Saprospiraceae bacterium]
MKLQHFATLLVLICSFSADAQSFLQLEKRGTLKTDRYYEGEDLIFRLHGDETWYQEQILEIMIEDELVLFENRVVPISKIRQIRNFQKGDFWRGLGNKLMAFGGAFLGFSLLGTLVDWELKADTFYISGGAAAAGGLLRLIFNHRTYKLGKKRWLRPMNLEFSKSKA